MTQVNSIKTWAMDDRPREKLATQGKEVLSNAELIAILLGSGSRTKSAVSLAREILADCKQDLNILSRQTAKDLVKFTGMGPAKAITIIAAMELGRRRPKLEEDIVIIKSSEQAYQLFRPILQDQEYEQFWILCVDRRNKVLAKKKVSEGGSAGTLVDPKKVFKLALEEKAHGILLFHNHPSGNLQPSKEDLVLTKKLLAGGKLLDISVLDHIIVAGNAYYSFVDNHMLQE